MHESEGPRRIKPADVPFSPDMADEDVQRLASISAFSELDAKFRNSAQFQNILRMHTRRLHCQDGDIIVRRGDWGNSAFFIISGEVVVEIEPPGSGLPAEVLGRRRQQRKTLWQALAQLWSNHRTSEFRDTTSYFTGDARVATRGEGQDTRIYLQDVPSVMQRYKHEVMEAGQVFGEIAALGRCERTATVFAKGTVELLEVRWQGLRDLMRRDEGMRKRIDAAFREKSLKAFLRASPLFRHCAEDEVIMAEVAQQCQLETFGEYDRPGSFRVLAEEGEATDLADEPLIAQEGDYPNGVIMIRSGLARVSQRHHHGHRTVAYLSPGQMFGFTEIAETWKSNAPVSLQYSLRAIGFLVAVIIPTALLEKYVLDDKQSPWRTALPARHQDPRKKMLPLETSRVSQDLVEFLVQRRIVNGSATMLIDLDRCTRCDDCVRACASTHDNNPRFLRHGPIRNNIMVANACMHCLDPVCMIECPTGAISRRLQEGAVSINDETCIGCSNCAKNCPYDAIRMVEIRDEAGQFIRDRTTAARAPITKATKCDLCVDQLGGPACQRACPHDALVRMDMSDVESLAAWYER